MAATRTTSPLTKTLWIVAFVLIALWALFPVVWILSLSLKSPSDIANRQFWPTELSWENYDLILFGGAQELFLPALRNSIGICLIATLVAVVLSTLAAYAIARLDFPGKNVVLYMSLAITVFPVISIVTPLFNLWSRIGLYDTWLGLIILNRPGDNRGREIGRRSFSHASEVHRRAQGSCSRARHSRSGRSRDCQRLDYSGRERARVE